MLAAYTFVHFLQVKRLTVDMDHESETVKTEAAFTKCRAELKRREKELRLQLEANYAKEAKVSRNVFQ